MRVQLLSDLHFEFHADEGLSFVESMPPEGVDVLVLAGDIAVAGGIEAALSKFCARYANSTVVYVHGNHEFYGGDRDSVVEETRSAARQHANLAWLDCDAVVIQGRRFLGTPLWFRCDDEAALFKGAMPDFSRIRGFESWAYRENARALDFLDGELQRGDVVITHHLPSRASIAPQFAGHATNSFFVCDVEADLLEPRGAAFWMHGHTHCSLRYRLGDTTVVCNPFGYVPADLNRDFDDALVLEL
jgi:predicted phosphodiesterase